MANQNHQCLVKTSSEPARWRTDLDGKILRKIADQNPLSTRELKRYLLQCNEAMRSHILVSSTQNPIAKFMLLGCADARFAILGPRLTNPQFHVTHDRVAGNTFEGGNMDHLRDLDLVIVAGHRSCGACAAAHQLHKANTIHSHDNIAQIVRQIPTHLAGESDPAIRDPENAIAQAEKVQRALQEANFDWVETVPMFFDWDRDTGDILRVLKLSGEIPEIGHANTNALSELRVSASEAVSYARAEGRNFNTQYASTTILADPNRLAGYMGGYPCDPHMILGLLPNEAFVVSDQGMLGDVIRRGSKWVMNPFAHGSMWYAGFDEGHGHYGHVLGVNQSHMIVIMDPDPNVLRMVRTSLLSDGLVKELTKGGEHILMMQHTPETMEVKFID